MAITKQISEQESQLLDEIREAAEWGFSRLEFVWHNHELKPFRVEKTKMPTQKEKI